MPLKNYTLTHKAFSPNSTYLSLSHFAASCPPSCTASDPGNNTSPIHFPPAAGRVPTQRQPTLHPSHTLVLVDTEAIVPSGKWRGVSRSCCCRGTRSRLALLRRRGLGGSMIFFKGWKLVSLASYQGGGYNVCLCVYIYIHTSCSSLSSPPGRTRT